MHKRQNYSKKSKDSKQFIQKYFYFELFLLLINKYLKSIVGNYYKINFKLFVIK